MTRNPLPTTGAGLDTAKARVILPEAQAARLLCAVTFHFVERRTAETPKEALLRRRTALDFAANRLVVASGRTPASQSETGHRG